jgi:alkaline phosphatase
MTTYKKIAAAAIICIFSLNAMAQQKPKNVIYMIGDGMGLAQVYAGMTANHDSLNLLRCPFTGFSRTYSANDYITDSAAGGTALACGVKTKNGMIGMNPDSVAIPSVLDYAAANDKKTGVIASCSVTHATPASFVAHQDNREKNEEIAADYLKSPVDVFIGGGLTYFTKRKDEKDLTKDLKKKGFTVATDMDEVKNTKSGKLAGLVAKDHPESIKGGRGDLLLDGTNTAIRLLSQGENGFFLMIEGSQIDWACHKNNESYMIAEMLDFDKVIGSVLDFAAKDGNTLVVITADHETGGLTILNGDFQKGKVSTQFNTLQHTGLMVPVYAFGPGAEKFSGIHQNTEISNMIKHLLGK